MLKTKQMELRELLKPYKHNIAKLTLKVDVLQDIIQISEYNLFKRWKIEKWLEIFRIKFFSGG